MSAAAAAPRGLTPQAFATLRLAGLALAPDIPAVALGLHRR